MSVTHEAYPIAPRDGVPCRGCNLRPATYRAVRVGAHPHTMAAKYRCTECIMSDRCFRVMGPEKPPKSPTVAQRVRQSPADRAKVRELERWKTWVGAPRPEEPQT